MFDEQLVQERINVRNWKNGRREEHSVTRQTRINWPELDIIEEFDSRRLLVIFLSARCDMTFGLHLVLVSLLHKVLQHQFREVALAPVIFQTPSFHGFHGCSEYTIGSLQVADVFALVVVLLRTLIAKAHCLLSLSLAPTIS